MESRTPLDEERNSRTPPASSHSREYRSFNFPLLISSTTTTRRATLPTTASIFSRSIVSPHYSRNTRFNLRRIYLTPRREGLEGNLGGPFIKKNSFLF